MADKDTSVSIPQDKAVNAAAAADRTQAAKPQNPPVPPRRGSSANPPSQLPQAAQTPKNKVQFTPVPADRTPRPQKQEITVRVLVDCHTAIEWGILRKKPEFNGVLPENGILLSADVKVKAGESALKALKKALRENRIPLDENSGYVRGIGGLAEQDCGEESGWLYRVNGALPNASSADYPLKNGDKVEFLYTCEMGDIT